jgi:hypothetical protein
MTPHTTVTPAAVLNTVAQSLNDKHTQQPNLISFLMNHAMQQQELETKLKQQHFHEQQKSYVSALVGMFHPLLFL